MMMVNYEEKHFQDVCRLLKNNTSRIVWGDKAEETVVAVNDGEIVGVGGLYTNEMHPNRHYIGVYVDPACRRQGIGTELFTELNQKSVKSEFQATISSKDEEGTLFLSSLDFKLARKCFTPDLKKPSTIRQKDDNRGVISVEQIGEDLKLQLVSLQLDNYRLTHEAINPLDENVSSTRWKEIIFDELDESHSMLLIENNIIVSYILCYETEANEEIEIGYIGGREAVGVASLIPFYTKVIDRLISKFKVVSIEADDVDPFAYAALQCYDYDDSNSLDTYIS